MDKSYGRKEGETCGHEPLSERAKGCALFNGAFDSGFDRCAGIPSLKPEKDTRSIGA